MKKIIFAKMNNLQKVIITFYFSFWVTGSFAQSELPLNNTISLSYSKRMLADTNFHSSIRPFIFNYPKDNMISTCDSGANIHLSSTPILTVLPIIAHTQKPSIISTYGLHLTGNILKKFSLGIDLYGGYFSLSNNNLLKVDSLSTLPHFTNHFNLNEKSIRFFDINGYLNYSPNHIFTFSIGKGKQFWGNGYRSLFLSDNTNPYPYLKATVSAWKIKYVWLVSFLQGRFFYDTVTTHWQSKYTASHFLSWHLTKWFNLNLFESVVWRGRDTAGIRNLDVNYLNPIIFYRPVEFSLGSPDNVIMGGGFNINILKKITIYNQFIFDEFKLAEIKSGNGWWGNKYGWQTGIKFFWKKLFFRSEYNYVRPFTYSHKTSLEAYGAWRQPLAHPLGANFDEYLLTVIYKKGKHMIRLFTSNSRHGISSDFNAGDNIFRPYNDNNNEYGNTMLQGDISKVYIASLSYGYDFSDQNFFQFISGIQLTKTNKKTGLFFFVGIKTNFMNYFMEDYLK
ncbi:MAG TPA: hypothetical protein EYP69_01755 [Bacteroidales bacterium]|nr:hypothetical protein [Bacteroidales bacterium]